jgi:hypothetical protein
MLLFRVVASLGALVSGVLIWRIVNYWEPRWANQALVLWLWSPLVILESALSGHNDTVMMALVLTGVGLMVIPRYAGSGLVFASAIAVKLSAVLALPPLLVGAWHEARTQGCQWRWMIMRIGLGLMVPLGAAVAVGGPRSLAVGSLGSGAERYTNSVHEPLTALVRMGLGENPEVAQGPLDDLPRTVRIVRATTLWSATGGAGAALGSIDSNQSVIAVGSAQAGWYHVLDPHAQVTGYIRSEDTRPFGRVRDADADLAQGSIQSRLEAANALLRLVGWALFIPSALLVLWRTHTVQGGLFSSALLMGLFLLFLGAWIWPWYMLWPLALGALTPRSAVTLVIAALSVTPLMLYPAFNFQGTAWSWLFQLRSIYVWVIPGVICALFVLGRWREVRSAAVS